ncbi:hypothetical protein QBC47DRAFT_198258 [Echria macrotheca]|uniref:Uncharacterized protein n=1 Tax=Echria macrotheca TaxID=438768 RepID=A0AAJ0FC58_9PEZI|nr:hypothetical protein QBC47DRAFT_198258 [Echria macrotheca]
MADPAPTPPRPAAAPRSLTNSRPPLPRRQSRFTEEMTDDFTPSPSIYEHDSPSRDPSFISSSRGRISLSASAAGRDIRSGRGYTPSTRTAATVVTIRGGDDEHPRGSVASLPGAVRARGRGGSLREREYRPLELIFRGMNGCTHGAACVILIAIMIEFLSQWEGYWLGQISAQAIALLVFLGLDTLLDIISLVYLYKPWPAWALVLRLADAIVYISMFMAYIAHGRVFPAGFTFWGMAPGWAGPVVYVFLWLLGVWNLTHIALRRHRLGKALRGVMSRCESEGRRRNGGRHERMTPRWRRWIRVGEFDAHSNTHTQRQHDIEINAQRVPSETNFEVGEMQRTVAAPRPIVTRETEKEKETQVDGGSGGSMRREVSAGGATDSTYSPSGGGTSFQRKDDQDVEEKEVMVGGLSPPPPRTKM